MEALVYSVGYPEARMEIAATVPSDLPRKLGLIDALSIVIGMVIGGGIFLAPNLVAQDLKSATAILAVRVFAGVISFFGALACAELGTALPSNTSSSAKPTALWSDFFAAGPCSWLRGPLRLPGWR